jgi:stage II sporulation protein M
MRRQKRSSVFKVAICNYINDNAKTFIIVSILFFIGLIIGIMFVNNTSEEVQNQIGGYINNFINSIKDNKQISQQEMLKEYLKNDVFTVLLLWFLGSTVIGIPLIYLFIIYKGYSIGYTISSIIATMGARRGIIFVIITMLLKYIIYIPCILALSVSGIKLYKAIIKDRRSENIKIQIIKHTLLCILILIVIIISSLISIYILSGLKNILIKWC